MLGLRELSSIKLRDVGVKKMVIFKANWHDAQRRGGQKFKKLDEPLPYSVPPDKTPYKYSFFPS